METVYQVTEIIISRGVVQPGPYSLQTLHDNLTDEEIARCIARGAIAVVEVKTELEETENVKL